MMVITTEQQDFIHYPNEYIRELKIVMYYNTFNLEFYSVLSDYKKYLTVIHVDSSDIHKYPHISYTEIFPIFYSKKLGTKVNGILSTGFIGIVDSLVKQASPGLVTSFSQDLHKREAGPIFSPAEQQTGWVYGEPLFKDLRQNELQKTVKELLEQNSLKEHIKEIVRELYQDLRQDLMKDIRQDLKQELKQELRQDLKQELKQELRQDPDYELIE
jgi:hypothetical protein